MKVTEDSCTEWFDARTKPEYIGVYQVNPELRTVPLYRYWDGRVWYRGDDSPRGAKEQYNKYSTLLIVSSMDTLPWRGLKHKPVLGQTRLVPWGRST